MTSPGGRKRRFLQVNTFYPAYLRDFYAARPELQSAPFATHIDALLDDGFSGGHMLVREFARLGWEGHQIIANAAPAQRAWLAENQLTLPEPLDIGLLTAMQIQMMQPDVVYFTDVIQFDSKFLRKLPTRPKLLIGWRGFGIPPGTDLSSYDAIVSSFDRTFVEARQFGAKDVQRHYPGFPTDFPAPEPIVYDRDVVFSGSVTSSHATRVALLQQIWRASRAEDGGPRSASSCSCRTFRCSRPKCRSSTAAAFGATPCSPRSAGRASPSMSRSTASTSSRPTCG